MSKMRTGCFIQEVNYEFAMLFIGKYKHLILKPDYKYIACYVNGLCVSILGYKRQGETIKIHCNYTIEEMRNRGYFSRLLKCFIEDNYNCVITADCLDSSKNVYLKLGFKEVWYKKYKEFNITRMRRESAKTTD